MTERQLAVKMAVARWGKKERPTPDEVVSAYADTQFPRGTKAWWVTWHRLADEVAHKARKHAAR